MVERFANPLGEVQVQGSHTGLAIEHKQHNDPELQEIAGKGKALLLAYH